MSAPGDGEVWVCLSAHSAMDGPAFWPQFMSCPYAAENPRSSGVATWALAQNARCGHLSQPWELLLGARQARRRYRGLCSRWCGLETGVIARD